MSANNTPERGTLSSGQSGRWVYAPGCRLPHWVVDPQVDNNEKQLDNNVVLLADSPTNRGVKSPPQRNYVNVPARVAAPLWYAPSGRGEVCGVPACDWLTLTATHDDGISQLFELARSIAAEVVPLGDELSEKRELMYTGFRAGRHVFYGENGTQGAYLRVSGSLAASAVDRVKAMRHRYFHATRYDAQLTTQFAELPDRKFFDSMAEASDYYAHHGGAKGRPWNVQVIKMFGKGDTAYIGDKATAEVYGRSYDKHREGLKIGVEYPKGAVRFEVSHRRELANMMLAEAVRADDLGDYHAGYVKGWFGARGVDVGIDSDSVLQLRRPRHQTDVEKRRLWFRSQVARGAQLNAAAIGVEATLHDLGLWDMVCEAFSKSE